MTTVAVEFDDETIGRVRQLAAMGNVSVAEMIRRLVRVRSAPPLAPDELGPLTRAATGIAPPMSDEEVERALDEYRMRKYGGQ
jgi:hypothetical protein